MRKCCEENCEKPVRLSEDMTVTVCRVCGAKHFEMTLDPGKLGIDLKGVG